MSVEASQADGIASAELAPHLDWRGGWTALAISTLARVVLAVLAGLLLCSLVPALFGWHPTVVMTGSMEPRLHPGDLAISRPVSSNKLQLGQILLVDDPDHPGRERLHRLAAFNPDGSLTLRGDANAANDSSPVLRSAVHGVGVLRVPYVGMPKLWLDNGDVVDVILLAGVLAALLAAACVYRADDDDDDDDVASGAADAATAAATAASAAAAALRTSSSRVVRGGAAGLMVAALIGIGLPAAAPARAATRFAKATTNSSNAWSAIPFFTCSAAALAANPSLYYQLSEANISAFGGTLTATDSSVNHRDGTYQSTLGFVGLPTGGATGPCSRDGKTAVTLNGTSGYVSTPGPAAAGPGVFSIEIRFKTTTTQGGLLLGFGSAQTGSSASHDRQLYLANSGQVVFGVNPSAGRTVVVSPKSYNDGSWHLADATLSSAGLQLYLDGQLVASNATVTTAQSYSGYWRIGDDNLTSWSPSPTSSFLAATIADAAVYPTALTAAQIAAQYSAA